LNISGKVNLAAQIEYRTDGSGLDLKFQAVPCPGLSVCSNRFPYKIDDVAGTIHYENGRVFSKIPLTGTHRNTKLRSGIDCRFNRGEHSVLRLAPLEIDLLQVDRELLNALPTNLQNFLESLQITKPFNLSGEIEYLQSAQGEQAVRWDLNWILFQNSAKLGTSFEHICGKVRLEGQSIADHIQLNGELELDSLTAYGFPVTSVRGPFSFNGKNLQLGIPMNRLKPEIASKPLTGKFCDGTMYIGGLVTLGNEVTYDINANLVGADLEKIAREMEPTVQRSTGKLNCVNVNLRGNGTKWETVSGTGQIQLREANIYGAPLMVRLLRELRIKETDPNAGMFSSMEYNFRLEGLQMYFNNVVFEGGAIFLQGDGMMHLDSRQIDLTMKTRLGSRKMQIPLVSDLIGGMGDQLVQLRITGPLNDPTITRVALPGVQQALQQMQPEDAVPPPADSRNRFAPSKMFKWNPL
jgi:hypothetical protein